MTDPRATPVSAVLWDCDGVLQHGIRGAVDELTALVGAEVLPTLFAEEQAALRGTETLRSAVTRVLSDLRLDVPLDRVLGAWDRYELDRDALGVVHAVRAAGIACYLATNQQDYRRDSMRPRYDDLVDGSFYSCEMGVAKPDLAFFGAIVTALDRAADRLLLLDDAPDNVTAARAAGLRAELIGPPPVAAQLVAVLASHGVLPGPDGGADDAPRVSQARP
jgi:putative hydrolase of the HAD superfamily